MSDVVMMSDVLIAFLIGIGVCVAVVSLATAAVLIGMAIGRKKNG